MGGKSLRQLFDIYLRSRDELEGISEDEAWHEDRTNAEYSHFTEQCLPPDQRSQLNLPHNLQRPDGKVKGVDY